MIELSVIIPTYNRGDRLQACLKALSLQTQSFNDFEVVVVIDGSNDETISILQNFNHPYQMRHIWQENIGQPGALNRGISEANGRYCLFLDDDIIASPHIVAEHLRSQREQDRIVGIGQITLMLPTNDDWYSQAFAQGWKEHYDLLNRDKVKLTWEDCYSGNMSVSREILLECGGFSENLIRGFDVELAYRLEKVGCNFIYLPQADGCQDERKDFRQLSKDAENSGYVDVNLYQRDPRMISSALASFSTGSWRKILLRRLLLAVNLSPRLLELWGRLIKNADRQNSWHSLIQNLSYWRGVRRAVGKTDLWARLTSGTPILIYHSIGSPYEQYGTYVINVQRFESHMVWIKRLGFQIISLEQFIDCLQESKLPPARSVVITFDDGYEDNFTQAYPVLSSLGYSAIIFLVSGHIGNTNRWDIKGELAGRRLMNWSQITELASKGITFGAHTCTHPLLTAISSDNALKEIVSSRILFEQELNKKIDAFAYPYGDHDQRIQKLVNKAGFVVSCTVDAGLNNLKTSPMTLHRTEIQGTDSILRLWLALWLGDAEAICKRKKYNRN